MIDAPCRGQHMGEVVSLHEAPGGVPLQIISILGGRSMRSRLNAMGLTDKSTLSLVKGGYRGPILVEVRGARIGLGQGISSRILVRPFLNDKVRSA